MAVIPPIAKSSSKGLLPWLKGHKWEAGTGAAGIVVTVALYVRSKQNAAASSGTAAATTTADDSAVDPTATYSAGSGSTDYGGYDSLSSTISGLATSLATLTSELGSGSSTGTGTSTGSGGSTTGTGSTGSGSSTGTTGNSTGNTAGLSDEVLQGAGYWPGAGASSLETPIAYNGEDYDYLPSFESAQTIMQGGGDVYYQATPGVFEQANQGSSLLSTLTAPGTQPTPLYIEGGQASS